MAIDGLDQLSAEKLRASITAYIQACGCAAGGAVAIVSLATLLILGALRLSQSGVRWTDLWEGAAGILGTLLLAGFGKLVGVTIARLRFEHCCRNVIQRLDGKRA